jgi:hypothetical protein
MARNVLAAVLLFVGWGSAASAQDLTLDEPNLLYTDAESSESMLHLMPEFGLRAGYIKLRDADSGTWFGGIQVRIPLASSIALEGSIEFHTSEFEDGDIEVVQYPVEATLLIFLFPELPVCPYILGGGGWYYTRVNFSGVLSSSDDTTTHFFGGHLGAGVRIGMGGAAVLNADVRYIFVEPDEDELEDENFDAIQIVLALSFPF